MLGFHSCPLRPSWRNSHVSISSTALGNWGIFSGAQGTTPDSCPVLDLSPGLLNMTSLDQEGLLGWRISLLWLRAPQGLCLTQIWVLKGGMTAGKPRGLEQCYPNIPLSTCIPSRQEWTLQSSLWPLQLSLGQIRLCLMERSFMDGEESAPGCSQVASDPAFQGTGLMDEISNCLFRDSDFPTVFLRKSHHFCHHL